MTCGIYMITNKKTGQKYVGQSIDIEDRWGRHCRKRTDNSSYVDRAIEKYGKDKFRINVITELPPYKKLLSIHEKYWIKFYNTFEDDFHYNLTPGGETVMLGRHHTEESKKRMSEVKLGEQNPFYNKKHTEETKKLMSKNHADVSGENNPHYGKPREMKTKLKVSEKQNTTGYFRVIKAPCKQCKQGFRWRYTWREMGERKELSSVNIKDLEKKVKEKGLEWKVLK